ncbi:MAG: thiamine phosphate synthase [Erythrobacter sp.]
MSREQPSLPLLWLLSDARNDAGIEDALRALPRNSGFVFRHYHLDPDARCARFDELAAIARSLGHTVILGGTGDWGADGSYGPPDTLGTGLRLATAHDGDEMRAAIEAKADAIFLSPVFATASHPDSATLGVHGFHVLAQQSPVPVIALGGMTYQRARELDWPRWGAIDGLGSTNRA